MVYIYRLDLVGWVMEQLEQCEFQRVITDVKVVGDYILTLETTQLCLSATYQHFVKSKWSCTPLSSVVPR